MKNLFLVHGAFCSENSFNYIRRKISEDYLAHRIHCFEYAIEKEKIEDVIERARKEIQKITEENGLDTVIVGHSLGGIITLKLSQMPSISTAITLSAPLSGLRYNIWLGSLLSWHAPTLRDISPSSNFISRLHNEDYSRTPIEVLVTTKGFNPMILEPNDGVITIEAQTKWQPEGATITQCRMNHNEILQSPQAIEAIEKALQS